MKLSFVLIVTSTLFISPACQVMPDSVVGSDKDVEINGLNFTVTRTYITSSGMYADGIVHYTGITKVSSPWFIEGQFYTDSTYTLKLGGSNVQINVPLESNQGVVWTLSFYPSQGNAQAYPNFKIGNLRGIYKKL